MHGLLDSSSGWVVMRPSHGLAYILADHGFDVWLGNSRGNRYSRKHTHLNPDYPEQRKQFWNFSWHEMGVHDLPAMIDYILKQSGRQKLHYIGHSQGTTAYFVMNSERPEYNDKIILANMLCPSAYYGPMPKPFLHYLNSFRGAFQLMTDYMEVYELLPSREFYGEAMQFIFEKINIAFILDGIGPALTGESPEQANTVSMILLSFIGLAFINYFSFVDNGTSSNWPHSVRLFSQTILPLWTTGRFKAFPEIRLWKS